MKNKLALIAIMLCVILCGYQYLELSSELNAKKSLVQYMQEKLNSVTENLKLERTKSDKLAVELDHMTKSLATANATISELKNMEYKLVYMGDFKITYYCDEEFEHICGYGDHLTASGKSTKVGWTAAADWGVLPNGSVVYISGVGFREITDVGGAVNGKHIDVLVERHDEALGLGTSYEDVWILVENKY